MAIDETQKRRTIAKELSNLSGSLMDVLYALRGVQLKCSSGSLVFTDADFAGIAGLSHLTADRVNTGLTTITTLLNAFNNNNFDDVFETLRS